MAVRIHVTATLSDQDSVRKHFREILGEGFDNINIEATPPWNFFTTSVWGVASSKLIEGLQRTGDVGLVATTEDASRWYLTLVRPGNAILSFLHEFHLFHRPLDPAEIAERPEMDDLDPRLAFLEPDPDPGSQRPWSQFDSVAESYSSAGVPIETAFRDRVQFMTYGEAVNEFRTYESSRLANALEEAGLHFDRQQLIDALLWNSVTDRECDSDIGNLPRVLLALGLQGSIAGFFTEHDLSATCADDSSQSSVFEETGDDGEDEDEDDEFEDDDYEMEYEDDDEELCDDEVDQSRPGEFQAVAGQSGDSIGKDNRNQWGDDTFLSTTHRMASTHPLSPILGGGVELNRSELSILDFFAQAVSVKELPPTVVTLIPPEGINASEFSVPNPGNTDIEVRPCERGWLIGLRSLDYDQHCSCLGRDLAGLFRRPPEGTQLSVDIADAERPEICLRFAGAVTKGKWQIEMAFPQLDRESFSAALALARQTEQDEYELADEEEAAAILQAANRDGYLHNMGVTRQGNKVRCEYDGMGFVARLILRQRFGHVWDFGPALKNIEQEWQVQRKMAMQMRRQAVAMRRNSSPPFDRSRVILRGESSVFWAADLGAWSVLEEEPRIKFEEGMKELGFDFLGDFVCKKVRNFVQRCFVSPDHQCYALLLAGSFGYVGYEFVSRFENEARLTTSTCLLAQSHPEIDVYAQYCPGMELKQLFERHVWGIGRFQSHKDTLPIRQEPTLIGLCKQFDQMLALMSTVESDLISFETIEMEDNDE